MSDVTLRMMITFLGSTAVVSLFFFFFSSRRRHTIFDCDWSSDVCSSDLGIPEIDNNAFAILELAFVEDLIKQVHYIRMSLFDFVEKHDRVWIAANSLRDRKSTRLNSSHSQISYAVFCLKKKKLILQDRRL